MTKHVLLLIILIVCSATALSAVPDLSSPEATLAGYIESMRLGDDAGIAARYHLEVGCGVDCIRARPHQIEKYVIVQKIIFKSKNVNKWNALGALPFAQLGDVELKVQEMEGGKEYTYSYLLRKFNRGWLILSHDLWDDKYD